ncbi:MAG TPA: GNAT family N-acetyltransferase [Candidatus Binatia bacterium]|jgi:ribosomal protein S18 acetylase RimI-like enzyme|nr:GNAT family N-acetyltransferase [Candidatus Binatia bacterium]
MKMIVQDESLPIDTQVVEHGLIEHALAAGIEPRNYRPLVIFLYDETETVVGGLVAATVWGWLHVKEFWIAEQYRSQGWGTKLLELAERQAMGRQCHHAFLDTFDFQALGFYQQLGYEIFGSLADFPQGHVRYFVKKCLVSTEGAA